MSDGEDRTEDFLRRWSRRKQAAKTPARDAVAEGEPATADEQGAPASPGKANDALPIFDPATLPPIESITAASDIRAFLAPGVPEELSRAALRRAWRSDPAIRDFIGLAENQWDFTKPDGVPGFGLLKLTPELRRVLAGLFGNAAGAAKRDADVPTVAEGTVSSGQAPEPATELPVIKTACEAGPVQAHYISQDDVALQTTDGEADDSKQSARQKHGSALPK